MVCCVLSPSETSDSGRTSWPPSRQAIRSGTRLSSMLISRWIAQAFADALGSAATELDAVLASDGERPQVHLAVRLGMLSAAELAVMVHGTVGRYSPYAVYLSGGDPGRLVSVRDGAAWSRMREV